MVREALLAIPEIREAAAGESLVDYEIEFGKPGPPSTGAAKRQIVHSGETEK